MGMGRNFFIWLGVFVALSLAVSLWGGDPVRAGAEKLAFSEFMDRVESKIGKAALALAAIALSLFCDWALLAPVFTLLFAWARGSRRVTA